jgi:hypothetical protein
MVGMYKEQNWNKSSLTYTFSNEAFIEFFSAQISPTNYEVQGVTFYS